jgi:hypothetical protein
MTITKKRFHRLTAQKEPRFLTLPMLIDVTWIRNDGTDFARYGSIAAKADQATRSCTSASLQKPTLPQGIAPCRFGQSRPNAPQ